MTARSAVQAQDTTIPANVFASKTKIKVENRRGWNIVDDSITTLFFENKSNGGRIATLVNFGAHPTILSSDNSMLSSDYVHSLREAIEFESGGMTLFLNGILGDSHFKTDNRELSEASRIGNEAARLVLESEKKRKKIDGDLKITTLPFTQQVTNRQIIALYNNNALDIDLNDNNEINTKILHGTIGKNLSFISFPGEALTRLGLPIKKNMKGDFKLFFGLSNASYGYFIPNDEFLKVSGRNTEEVFSMDENAGTNIKNVIIDHLKK
ncbi:hypothetical protein [Vibrio jasicida]|uniref:hypothetical protein n=1 Tax=Vibrio jasicida TaxID=766224 RepID=UPI0003A9A837|nr:hypothetical protein [Vibrio jasicida]